MANGLKALALRSFASLSGHSSQQHYVVELQVIFYSKSFDCLYYFKRVSYWVGPPPFGLTLIGLPPIGLTFWTEGSFGSPNGV